MSGKYKQLWFYEAMAHLPYKAFCYIPEHHVSLCNPVSSCRGHLRILDANVVVTCATSKEQALSEAWRLFPTAISFNEPIREEQVREELIMRRAYRALSSYLELILLLLNALKRREAIN